MSAAPELDALGLAVAPDDVERALADFWKSEEALTKASLINLVILTPDEGRLAANHELAASLTRDHACRVILVEARDTGPPVATRAWISAHCHLAGGRRTVCSEQIAFLADARVAGLTRSLVLAHLASDLPVVCWWQGRDAAGLDPSLLSVVDRLVIDSAGFAPGGFNEVFAALEGIRAAMARPFSLHDLAWARTFQSRLALASLFDHPLAAGLVSELNGLEIAPAAGDRSGAALLAAWVVHALGWEPLRAGAEGWVCRAGKHEATVALLAAGGAATPALALRGGTGRVAVRPAGDGQHLAASIEAGGASMEFLLPADSPDPSVLVAGLLSRAGHNPLYQAVLPMFLRLNPWPGG
jgi:glucose-6-phosphate dehydrogenase assembly protein OpcA